MYGAAEAGWIARALSYKFGGDAFEEAWVWGFVSSGFAKAVCYKSDVCEHGLVVRQAQDEAYR
ncbi:MAG: hypothetical protein B7Y90_11000 [Alphaproteobacteria bacterium 32-64-14]|nr:MAG: hypothetical protein B7Y90_11000 [Alphaproteobacteria bacterium 32-64-14]